MDRPKAEPTWEGARVRMQSLAAANHRAWVEWLDSLSIESSIRAFEDLCTAYSEVVEDRLPKDRPLVLFTIWKP